MAFYNNMTTVIQLNSQNCCECIHSVRAALSHMYGVTSVIVDSTYATVKVIGRADPYDILSVVQSYDMYARLLWSKPTAHTGYSYGSYGPHGHSHYDHNCYNGYYYQPHCGPQYNSGCNIM